MLGRSGSESGATCRVIRALDSPSGPVLALPEPTGFALPLAPRDHNRPERLAAIPSRVANVQNHAGHRVVVELRALLGRRLRTSRRFLASGYGARTGLRG